MSARDNAVLRAGIRMIGVVDHHAALGIGDIAGKVADVNQLEGVERFILFRIAEHSREVESASGNTGYQRGCEYECESRRENSFALCHPEIEKLVSLKSILSPKIPSPNRENSVVVAAEGGGR